MWGCISSKGPGPIKVIRGTMDGDKYLQTLAECIIPYKSEIGVFQQDNRPPHKTHTVLKALSDAQIPVLDCPPYSPDVNCIENIWAILKDKVHKMHANNMADLETHILEVWANDESLKVACRNVVQSMTNRIRLLRRNKGVVIKY